MPRIPKPSPALRRARPGNIKIPLTIASAESLGFKDVKIVVLEGEEVKRMTMKVFVQSPLTVQVSPVLGRPGKTQVTVEVGNHSGKAIERPVAPARAGIVEGP